MKAADVTLSWFAPARLNEGGRSWRMVNVVVASLLIGHVGTPYAQQPTPLPTGGAEYPGMLAGGTALHRAAYSGDVEKIQELLQSGADIEARDGRGFTPLHEAIWGGKQEAVKLLLERGANVKAPINSQSLDWTPLHEAARFGFNSIIDMLLEKGADINSKNTKGRTPFDVAVEYRQAGTVKHVVARGAKASSEVREVASGGESEGRKYVSPLGNFSAEFPKMGPGVRIQDPHDKDSGWVSVHDDVGNLRSIMYLRLSAEEMKALTSVETRRPALEAFLTAYIMPEQIKRASPKATVQHTEHVNLGNDSALFAVVDIPEGSTASDVRANRRYDTKRGLLIFNKGNFMYMLSSGENPTAPHLVPRAMPLDLMIETEKYKLQSFLSRIEFK